MNDYERSSTFGTLLGAAGGAGIAAAMIPGIGWAGLAIGGLLGGSTLGGIFGSKSARKKEKKQLRKLQELQQRQATELLKKRQQDAEELYQSVSGAVSTVTGATGGVL